MYLAGPFKGAPLSLAAITPALAGPYDYGIVVVRVALHVDPLDAHVTRRLRHGPLRSSAGSRSGCARSRSTSTARTSRSTRPTAPRFTVDSQGIGDQGTVTDFSSYFHAVNCATLGFKPKMTSRSSAAARARRRGRNPELQFDLRTRAGRCQHQIDRGDPLERLRDRPAPPRQYLLGEASCGRTVRRAAQPIGTAGDEDAAARPASQGPGLRGLRLRRIAPARLHPQRPGDPIPRADRDRQRAACGRPSRSSPTPRSATSTSTSSAVSTAISPTPGTSAPTGRSRRSATPPRTAGA